MKHSRARIDGNPPRLPILCLSRKARRRRMQRIRRHALATARMLGGSVYFSCDGRLMAVSVPYDGVGGRMTTEIFAGTVDSPVMLCGLLQVRVTRCHNCGEIKSICDNCGERFCVECGRSTNCPRCKARLK